MPLVPDNNDITATSFAYGQTRFHDHHDLSPVLCHTKLSQYCNTPHYAMIDDGADACTAQGGYVLTQIFEHDNYSVKSYHNGEDPHGTMCVHAITKTHDH